MSGPVWKTVLKAAALAGVAGLLAACGSSSKKSAAATQAAPVRPAQAVAAQATATPTVATVAPFNPAATPATSAVERLNGAVQSFDGSKVVLQDGSSFSVNAQTGVTRRVTGSPSSIQTGQTVAITAKQQPDSTLVASLIVIFPNAPSGFALGQRPLDGGNLMTNATVDKVSDSGFTATFPGGGAQVTYGPSIQVQMLATGTTADIKPGAMLSAAVRDGVAQSVSLQ
jgi:hypothetical protein